MEAGFGADAALEHAGGMSSMSCPLGLRRSCRSSQVPYVPRIEADAGACGRTGVSKEKVVPVHLPDLFLGVTSTSAGPAVVTPVAIGV
eukprot:CAMPEP_0115185910 /NCGR_PEP_ID=MMETSP0270-20121206/9713_1 /TAXON_ID=71861 /ORGANISM="Scrippsiella trochoidea, Strain CCMP3099" /LENGTH=87 /DNA_ID=CAMNT_0002599025 /DNA_START=347 /DNA_END=610 /DNA_ORIENTATION=+